MPSITARFGKNCFAFRCLRLLVVLAAAPLCGPSSPAYAAPLPEEKPIPLEAAKNYFAEARMICERDHAQLWGISICGPIMLVDSSSRFLVTNQADANGTLTKEEGVFTGTLPKDQNIANTEIWWSGVHWTQMMWPLPEEVAACDTLIAHELFHRIAGDLHIARATKTIMPDNGHLDTLDGRYYLQLEWRALTRALETSNDAERRKAIGDALIFRAERYRLFPNGKVPEIDLEMNEGLAEYTGVKLGNPVPSDQVKTAIASLNRGPKAATFVRSFAYATGPAYGLLLDQYVPNWRQAIRDGNGFIPLLEGSLHVSAGSNLPQEATAREAGYRGVALKASEKERDDNRRRMAAEYRKRFIENPVLTMTFRHNNIAFNPSGLQPLDNVGTVYSTARISDDWGVLEASKGVLIKQDWSAAMIPAPADTTGETIKGEGWTLTLKPGWKLVPAARKGDFTLAAPDQSASH